MKIGHSSGSRLKNGSSRGIVFLAVSFEDVGTVDQFGNERSIDTVVLIGAIVILAGGI